MFYDIFKSKLFGSNVIDFDSEISSINLLKKSSMASLIIYVCI